MKAQDVMITDVYKVKETDSVRDVLERFVRHKISGLPIVNEKNEIRGYISDGDILREVGKHKPHVVDWIYFIGYWNDEGEFETNFRTLLAQNVLKIATRNVITVRTDTPLDEVAAILGEKRIKKVIVAEDNVVKGVISRGDMIRFLMNRSLSGSS